jgi:hypothetical protein
VKNVLIADTSLGKFFLTIGEPDSAYQVLLVLLPLTRP